MPPEGTKRGSISYKPTGWVQYLYGNNNSKHLYERCHLIAWQLGNENKGKKIDDMELTQEENLKFYRKKSDFLQEYFKEELSDLSKGEIFLVTNKYENDYEYHRYKVAQYKDNKEWKYIAFEEDLPENVEVGDVVRKVDGKYIYDEQATKYVNDSIKGFKQDIIISRKKCMQEY